jgi:hypothetical protein
MKRRMALPLAAGLLVAAMLPGPALAGTLLGSTDQSNTSLDTSLALGQNVAQTFTAGKTGLLTGVNLHLSALSGGTANLYLTNTVSDHPNTASGILVTSAAQSPGTSGSWLTFQFAYPWHIVAGTKYSVVLWGTLVMGFADASTGNKYSSGEAFTLTGSMSSGTWDTTGLSGIDLAFETVVDAQSTTVAWNKASVPAGVSTALTLTETFVFPTWQGPEPSVLGARPATATGYGATVKAATWPSWFTPTGVACTGPIAPEASTSGCNLANVLAHANMSLVTSGGTATMTITGTGAPGTGDMGPSATATAQSCATYEVIPDVEPAQVAPECVNGSGSIAVGASPPPTVTGAPSSRSDEGSPGWLLIFGLAGAIGMATLVARRNRALTH